MNLKVHFKVHPFQKCNVIHVLTCFQKACQGIALRNAMI